MRAETLLVTSSVAQGVSQGKRIPRRNFSAGLLFRAASVVAAAAMVLSCSREPTPRSDADVAVAEVNGA
ncbi:MAG TPA: hypothetical protein VK863_01295, partial [Candidatus Limnocylindrales bacterium]|nr:hypothetical protein [Candidatus Limnocylindrales bacterium]